MAYFGPPAWRWWQRRGRGRGRGVSDNNVGVCWCSILPFFFWSFCGWFGLDEIKSSKRDDDDDD